MKHVVNFSGGMGSFAEAKSCVDKFGKENDTMLSRGIWERGGCDWILFGVNIW